MQGGLAGVVVDEGVVAVVLELAFDKERPAVTGGGVVGDADDSVDPLAVQDPLTFGDGVPGQLGPPADDGRAAPARNIGPGVLDGRISGRENARLRAMQVTGSTTA